MLRGDTIIASAIHLNVIDFLFHANFVIASAHSYTTLSTFPESFQLL